MSWIDNISRSRQLVKGAGQTDLAVIVSGSPADSAFWRTATTNVQRDILREDGGLRIASVTEDHPAGNFLGTLRAWEEAKKQTATNPTQGVTLMSMVFGQGKRMSPFTQALGGRKAAFPTPFRGSEPGSWLRTGDIAILYSSLWLHQLASTGFSGVLVKWGDEAILPSTVWDASTSDFRDVDIVRFVWKTVPDATLAREKEWWVLNEETRLIERLIPRQPYDSLARVLERYQGNRYSTAVNLGSIAISYRFLDLAREVLGPLASEIGPAADWDPFVNLLLLLADDEDPYADPPTAAGLQQAEKRCPGLTAKMKEIRAKTQQAFGRPPRAGYLEFGDALWIDLGLHTTLRRGLEALIEDSAYGRAVRAFFGVPEERDANGNFIVGTCQIAPGVTIRNSLVLDSTIQNGTVQNGIVVGSRHGNLQMPHGGASLFSAGRHFTFAPRAISFRSVADALEIPEGGRHTTAFFTDQPFSLVTNESVVKYDASEYGAPILGNPISFEEAARIAAEVDPWLIESRWREAWSSVEI